MYDKHAWGPHGPDGPVTYEWPDIYHPVPYGREFEGNQNLTLCGDEHWCPPRDHGRHGCDHHHEHGCHDACGFPVTVSKVLGEYIDTARKLLDATTYQERCDCVDELRRIKVKMEEVLKEFDKQLDQNDYAVRKLQQKVTYYIGKSNEVLKMLDENMARQDDLEEAVKEVGLLDFTNYYTKTETNTRIQKEIPKFYVKGNTLVIFK